MLSARISHQTRVSGTPAHGGDAGKSDAANRDTPFAAALDAAGVAPNGAAATLAGDGSGNLADGTATQHGHRDKRPVADLAATGQALLVVPPLPDNSANAQPASGGEAVSSTRGMSAKLASSDAAGQGMASVGSGSVPLSPGLAAVSATSLSDGVTADGNRAIAGDRAASPDNPHTGGALLSAAETTSIKAPQDAAAAAESSQPIDGAGSPSSDPASLPLGLVTPGMVVETAAAIASGAAAAATQSAAAAIALGATGTAVAETESPRQIAPRAADVTGASSRPGPGDATAQAVAAGQVTDPSGLAAATQLSDLTPNAVAPNKAVRASAGDVSAALAVPRQVPGQAGVTASDVAMIAAATLPGQSADREHSAWGAPASAAASAAAVAPGVGGASTATSSTADVSAPASPSTMSGTGTIPDQVATQLVRLVSTDSRGMVMHLRPPELGDLTVRVAVAGHGVSAWFSSPQPQVRDAISAGMGQLQTSLAAAGYNLNGAWVGGGDASNARQQNTSQPPAQPLSNATAPSSIAAPAAATSPQPIAAGLNVYA
jgi:flagellar hook-length control protein FliK